MTDDLDDNGNPIVKDGSPSVESDKVLKEGLEKALGKQFPDAQTALKAVKDTFDYVGKAGKYSAAVKSVMESKGFNEDQAVEFIKNSALQAKPEIDGSKFVSREEFEKQTLYSEKPELKPYASLIDTFKKANPEKSINEILELPAFKDVFSKASEHDKIVKQKSILHSNPKLQVAEDKMTKAQEFKKSGDQKAASDAALGAVMDAFPVE